MKLIIQKADNFKEVNKIIEIESTNINDNDITYFIKANETPVIKYTDTNETFLINNIQESLKQYEGSEILLIVNESYLISLGGSSFNIKGQFENNTEAINNGLVVGDIYSLPIIDNVSLLAVVVSTYNFDLTSPNWASEGVTDEVSFINWLEIKGSSTFTNIIVTDFNFVGDRIFCNMTADGTDYDLGGLGLVNADKIGVVNGLTTLYLNNNQIVTFNPTTPLPSSLTTLDLNENQIVTFNPTTPLPSSLTTLYLSDNQIVTFNPTTPLPSSLTTLDLGYNRMTLAGYTASEVWANAQPSFTNPCNVSFGGNIDSISGTNLEDILISKNCNVIFA